MSEAPQVEAAAQEATGTVASDEAHDAQAAEPVYVPPAGQLQPAAVVLPPGIVGNYDETADVFGGFHWQEAARRIAARPRSALPYDHDSTRLVAHAAAGACSNTETEGGDGGRENGSRAARRGGAGQGCACRSACSGAASQRQGSREEAEVVSVRSERRPSAHAERSRHTPCIRSRIRYISNID